MAATFVEFTSFGGSDQVKVDATKVFAIAEHNGRTVLQSEGGSEIEVAGAYATVVAAIEAAIP